MADFDKENVLRIDNTLVVNFFSSSASILLKHEVISDKDVQDFRSSLNRQERHPLGALIENNDKILYLLEKRYASQGLMQNLVHYTWNPALSSLIAVLQQWGSELLEKSHVYFNRGVLLTSDPLSKRSELYSKILVDLAESLDSSCKTLKTLLMTPWLAHSFFAQKEESETFEKELSSALGFEKVKDLNAGVNDDGPARLADCLSHLLAKTHAFYADSERLTKLPRWQEILVLREELKHSTTRLKSMELGAGPLQLLELQRQQLIALLGEIRVLCKQVGDHFVQHLAVWAKLPGDGEKTVLSDNIHARLCYELGRDGMPPSQIDDIVSSLIRYCEMRRITPQEILSAECQKIHPNLNKRGLEIFQALTRQDLYSRTFTREKGETLSKIKMLEQEFLDMKTFVYSLSFVSVLAGCGVRSSPQSDTMDFRPPVPFIEPLETTSKEGERKGKATPPVEKEEKKDDKGKNKSPRL
ncbi:MAG: hypothetical protein HYW48_12700 [Deltaproteobacteria bacterium]|nr:hypothetical protein [Deltaproteobacteria bacterium]